MIINKNKFIINACIRIKNKNKNKIKIKIKIN